MSQLSRTLLGLSVIVVLVPLVSFAVTGDLGWSGDPAESSVSSGSVALAKAERLGADPEGPIVTDDEGDNAPDGGLSPSTDSERSTSTTNLSPTTEEDQPAHHAEGAETPTSTSGDDETASNDSSHDESNSPAASAEATISGDACPCTVTGASELKGTVNLRGDIIVDGGLLVARPGLTVNGNGFQIMFMNGGRADFQGSNTSTWSGNGSNANLKRDITFKNLRRIMFHQKAGMSTLRFFTIADSGTTGVLGDYPLHFHLNGNSVRGTLVEGVVVVNGRNHAFVPHGSHGIAFRDIVAKNTTEEAFWWDPPVGKEDGVGSRNRRFHTENNSNDITVDHALVDGVDTNRRFKMRISAFELGAGSGNSIRNSVARNVASGKQCSGFHWPQEANQNDGGNVWTFENNASYNPSGCVGIFVWQNDGGNHSIRSFFSDTGVDHGAYKNRYAYVNLDVPSFTGHALGWEVRDSSIGDVLLLGHSLSGDPVRFTNVQLRSFVIDNRRGVSSPNPGTYLLSNAGISCGDVVVRSIVAGTRVVIDGEEC